MLVMMLISLQLLLVQGPDWLLLVMADLLIGSAAKNGILAPVAVP